MTDGATRLEGFLHDLRARLAGLPAAEVDEIVAELRSHVRDSAGADPTGRAVAAVLERLGPPAELAAQFATERLLARAQHSGSPWLLLRGLYRGAGIGIAGGAALLALVVGYVAAASLLVAALMKPFAPDRVGLWRLGSDELSLRLGLAPALPPPRGEELLGWWIVPLGLLAAAAASWITAGFGRWAIRRFRRAPLAGAR
jgi:hypothetical protein